VVVREALLMTRIVVFLFTMSVAAAAQSTPAHAPGRVAGWDRMGQIPKTQKIKLHLRDGKSLTGTIQECGPEGLTLVQRKKKVVHVRREDIAEVTKNSRLKGAMWGGITGFGIGGAVGAGRAGYLVDKNNPTPKDRLIMGSGFGALFGGIGAAIGAATGMDQTIYRAARLKKPAQTSDSGRRPASQDPRELAVREEL
jgi:hypothetical protein